MSARIRPGDDPAALAEAAAAIRAGKPVAFPTETVYGLGANALDPVAVARVFEAKDRPSFDPLIVHFAGTEGLERYADPRDLGDARVMRLAARFWPGPLTIVVRKSETIPGIVTAGLDTVGLRVPDHPIALRLIAASGVPIAAPSANRFGGISPTRAEHVRRQLGDRIGLILDGGPARIGLESTVLLLADGRRRLLRPGGLTVEEIESEIGPLEAEVGPLDAEDRTGGRAAGGAVEDGPALSPGRMRAHYAPGVPLEIVPPEVPVGAAPSERVGLLAASARGRTRAESHGARFAAVEVPAPDGDPLRLAAGLFEALHRLDTADLDRIVVQPVPEVGLGRAIMDRLRRAAAAA